MIKRYRERIRLVGRVRGYTMVELIAVCMIISILAAISFALLSRSRSQVLETSALAALNSMATAYEMYYNHNLSYPQWGPGQEFSSPKQLFDYLIDREYLPRAYRNCTTGENYDPSTGYIYGFTQDYAMEIMPYDPLDATTSIRNSYFIVLHPYNFQRDSLAIGLNPPTGWVAVRGRRGLETDDYRTYRLYIPRRGGASY